MSTTTTPALQLLSIVWNKVKKDSWERINHAMREALSLAIGSGLTFKASDFDHMSAKFRWSYWVSESSEWIYTSAILNLNESCIAAYEQWKQREPFRANKVQAARYRDPYLHTSSIARERERLAVGMGFPHDGRQWWVTGFDDTKGTVRIASYAGRWQEGKPEKLRQLTHEQLKAICPAPKKAKKDLREQP